MAKKKTIKKTEKQKLQLQYLFLIIVALIAFVGVFFLLYFGLLVLINDISHGHDLKRKLFEYFLFFGIPGLLLIIFLSIWLSKTVKNFVKVKKVNLILVGVLVVIAISGMLVIGIVFYRGV